MARAVPVRERSRAYRTLSSREPVFARLVADYGRPDPFQWHDGGRTGSSLFAAMLLHIAGQQISAVVAFAVYDRIIAAAGGTITPASVIDLGPERLRACGLSRAKVGYALALAEAQTAGVIDIEDLDGFGDAEIVAALTAIRGIGVWSAETFLVHNLNRPDVLPAGDLGVRRAVQRQWHLDQLPSPGEVRSRAEAWAPYRAYAGALLWSSLRPPGEASDPKQRALLSVSRPAVPNPS
jgi:DNA-3-methyladenine glycosylase II